jgi:hypothetical protein
MHADVFARYEALQRRARQVPVPGHPLRAQQNELVRRLATELAATARELEGMRVAMRTRAAIEQAKGILMGLHGCGEQDAFAELVRISQMTQTKLRDVAAQLVTQVSQGAGSVEQRVVDSAGPTSDIPRAS